MRTIEESIEALEKWRKSDSGREWYLASPDEDDPPDIATFRARVLNRAGADIKVDETTAQEALHKLCEALGI